MKTNVLGGRGQGREPLLSLTWGLLGHSPLSLISDYTVVQAFWCSYQESTRGHRTIPCQVLAAMSQNSILPIFLYSLGPASPLLFLDTVLLKDWTNDLNISISSRR